MEKKLIGLTALASAALASVCCIGPLIVTGLGLSGLGLAAGLARYRPIFLALTGIALAAGFHLTYRKREVACPDGTCQLRSGSRGMKAALWTITIAALAMAAFPNWSSWALARKVAAAPAGARTLSFRITGMDCAACTVSIEKSVEKVPGVYSARVNFDRAQATVITDGKASPAAVIQAVKAAGYQATLLEEEGHEKSKS